MGVNEAGTDIFSRSVYGLCRTDFFSLAQGLDLSIFDIDIGLKDAVTRQHDHAARHRKIRLIFCLRLPDGLHGGKLLADLFEDVQRLAASACAYVVPAYGVRHGGAGRFVILF